MSSTPHVCYEFTIKQENAERTGSANPYPSSRQVLGRFAPGTCRADGPGQLTGDVRQKNIARLRGLSYISAMMTLTEVESLAFELPEQQRATLASRILDTLPPLFTDSDDGVAEAEHRDTEMNADASKGINLEQFDRLIARRR